MGSLKVVPFQTPFRIFFPWTETSYHETTAYCMYSAMGGKSLKPKWQEVQTCWTC